MTSPRDELAARDAAIAAAAGNVIREINHVFHAWKVPSVESCFDGIIEGAPSEEERKQMFRATEAARKVWRPSADALDVVEQLRKAVGHDVLLELWEPLMEMLPAEGPYPIVGHLTEVVVRNDADGFEQAYLVLRETREVRYPAGSPSRRKYLRPDGTGAHLCNVGALLRVLVCRSTAPESVSPA